MSWIVCQIGARENFSVARALHRRGGLEALVTDAWVAPGHPLRGALGRIGERSHPELRGKVWAPNGRAVLRELGDRHAGRTGWQQILHRNAWFQRMAVQRLTRVRDRDVTVFAYSYAAAGVLAFAQARGWRTVLGQIDPGPVEARLVDAIYEDAGQQREPIPMEYWENWRRETELADAIIVNSDWSRQGLIEEGVTMEKVAVIPLAYDTKMSESPWTAPPRFDAARPLKLLFLGQVTLRKGIDIALDALRKVPDLPVQIDVVGPLQIAVPDWARTDNRIRFHGGVPRSAVASFYAAADLFLFPTRSDGFGLTQLEALSAGVPVIASERCGKVVEDGRNGLLLRNLESAELAKLLCELVTDPARVAALRRGARLECSFSLDELGARLIEVENQIYAPVSQ